MKDHLRIALTLSILLITTLACSLTTNANPVNVLQTLVPAEAQTQAAGAAQDLVTTVVAPAVTELSNSTNGASSSACDNPLYPVVLGASWSYSLSGAISDTFIRSITNVTSDGFTDQDMFSSGTTRTGQWSCESGNLITLDPKNDSTTANVQTSSSSTDYQTTSQEGITLPAVVNSGTSWSQNFTIEGTQDLNGSQVASKNVTAYTCTAAGEESITVAAGTFNTMRVECQTNSTITITMAGMEIPTSITSNSTIWYAQGVGMVKEDSLLGDGSTTTTELTFYFIP